MSSEKTPVIPKKYLITFILVTLLFPLWGFANDITNPMVAAFKKILLISNFESSLVQAAFYGGYCFMAIPAALFIKKYSYKKGILVGLALYSASALFFPIAGEMGVFWAFLLAFFTMTCGLSFLETTANPYILSLGAQETATRRLNLAQSFNPMGSICGMFVAMTFILANLTVVKHDVELAPMLAKKAHADIQTIVADDALDNAEKWKKIEEAGLSSWLIKSDKLKEKIDKKETVDWNVVLTSLENEHRRAADLLKIIKNEDLDDAEKWEEMKSQNLLAAFNAESEKEAAPIKLLNPEQSAQIQSTITDGKKATEMKSQNLLAALNAESKKEAAPIKLLNPEQFAQIQSTITDGKKATVIDYITGNSKGVNWEASPLLDSSPDEEAARTLLSKIDESKWAGVQAADLKVLQGPYFYIGVVVAIFFFIFLFKKLPSVEGEDDTSLHIGETLSRLFSNSNYVGGIIAQVFYVGAQIMIWTYIIQYAGNELGMRASTAQGYNILAMIIFVSSRFICTFLLKFVSPGGLLSVLAVAAVGLVLGLIFIEGMPGLWCLVAVSACMSLMFPTIYGIALDGLGDDAKLGAAGLILAIGGGCIMTPIQATIMDGDGINLGGITLSSTRLSFFLPLLCFIVIAIYGFLAHKKHVGEAK